jgi:soluble lytic murein transglycosylase-like protein
MKVLAFILLTAGAAGSLAAGEFAVLVNGFKIHADRHELDGTVVRLYSAGAAAIEFSAAQVASFEQEEVDPNPPPAPQTAAIQPPASPAKPVLSTRELVDAAAAKQGLPAKFVHSVVAAESAYRADAISPKGAIGLMQLMPATAKAYNADPLDPAQNVEAGAAYLRELLLKYDGDPRRALAAYNAGPGAVSKYNGVPPYAETQNYVERVLRKYVAASKPAQ